MKKQNRLGRGLDALLEVRRASAPESGSRAAGSEAAVDALQPGTWQPRRHIPEDTLAELAASIREQGVLQPLVVRPLGGDRTGGYEIVAGERRWRAARIAGLATVPVVVRELDDQSALAVALIENLQREDLDPVDQARSLSKLTEQFGLTHTQVAKALGRSRASVSNLLRLLDLHDEVKELLSEGAIDMGHARALLPLDTRRQLALARKAGAKGLSVRQVEKTVRDMLAAPPDPGAEKPGIDLQTRWLQNQIAEALGQKLAIRRSRDGAWALNIGFADLPELQQALRQLQELVDQVQSTAGPRVRDVSGPHALSADRKPSGKGSAR